MRRIFVIMLPAGVGVWLGAMVFFSFAVARLPPGLAQAEEQLRRALATKVRVIRSGHRGRIEVEFYSEEDLDRLVQKICAP